MLGKGIAGPKVGVSLLGLAILLSKVPVPIYGPPAVLEGGFLKSQLMSAFIRFTKTFHADRCEIGICFSVIAGRVKHLSACLLACGAAATSRVFTSLAYFSSTFGNGRGWGEMVLFSLSGRTSLHILGAYFFGDMICK